MALKDNAFIGRTEAPGDADLSAALGPSRELWDRLVSDLNLDSGEWNSYSPKAGWAYRLKKGKRNIIYLSPLDGLFRATVILGDKAIAAAKQRGLPKNVIKLIDGGTRYPEGTGIRVEVKKASDLAAVKKLVEAKLG